MYLRLGMLSCLLTLAGCSHYHHGYGHGCDAAACQHSVQDGSVMAEPAAPVEPIRLTETGVAAISELKKFSKAQKELMAMRASKLDAFRALSERLYGTTILGSSKVEDLVLTNDHMRTLVESLLRGAKVVSTRKMPIGGYETMVELVISPELQLCLSNSAYCKGFSVISAAQGGSGSGSGFYFSPD